MKKIWMLAALLVFAGRASSQTQVDDGHQLCVTSFPDGANVLLDGTTVMKNGNAVVTPFCVNKIPTGQHQISVSSPSAGWQADTRTINVLDVDSNGRVRDTHLSFTLMPTLTSGPPGPQGAQGPKGDAGPQGIQGPMGLPGLSITGPQGLPGPQGMPGANGAQGPIGLTGATGAIGAQGLTGPAGPQGLPGINGTNGANGAPGPAGPTGPQGATGPSGSSFKGRWVPGQTYNMGDMVLRNPNCGASSCGSVGPFWNVTGNGTADPALDSTNWAYCCGTPNVGYMPLTTTAPFNVSVNTSSPATLTSYVLNADESQTIQSLTLSSLTFTQTGGTATVSCDGIYQPCNSPAINNLSGLHFVSVGVNCGNCSVFAYSVPLNPIEALTWTLTITKSGTSPTVLTLSESANGGPYTVSVPGGGITLGPGDSVSLQVINQVGGSQPVSGTWTIN